MTERLPIRETEGGTMNCNACGTTHHQRPFLENVQDVHREAYRRRDYHCPMPPVSTKHWEADDWCRWIDSHGQWETTATVGAAVLDANVFQIERKDLLTLLALAINGYNAEVQFKSLRNKKEQLSCRAMRRSDEQGVIEKIRKLLHGKEGGN